MPSSRESSQSRDQTHVSCVSCIGRQILYHCTSWDALVGLYTLFIYFWLCWVFISLWIFPLVAVSQGYPLFGVFMHWRRKWQPTPVFLPGESQGLGSLVG